MEAIRTRHAASSATVPRASAEYTVRIQRGTGGVSYLNRRVEPVMNPLYMRGESYMYGRVSHMCRRGECLDRRGKPFYRRVSHLCIRGECFI